MIAKVQVFTHIILDHESLVTVQTASSTVTVEQSREWTQIDLPQWSEETLIKAHFIEENLYSLREMSNYN